MEALTEIRPLMVRGIACISAVAGTNCEEAVYKEGSAFWEEGEMPGSGVH